MKRFYASAAEEKPPPPTHPNGPSSSAAAAAREYCGKSMRLDALQCSTAVEVVEVPQRERSSLCL